MISWPGPGGSGGPWALALEDSDRVEIVRGLGINVPVVSAGLLVGVNRAAGRVSQVLSAETVAAAVRP